MWGVQYSGVPRWRHWHAPHAVSLDEPCQQLVQWVLRDEANLLSLFYPFPITLTTCTINPYAALGARFVALALCHCPDNIFELASGWWSSLHGAIDSAKPLSDDYPNRISSRKPHWRRWSLARPRHRLCCRWRSDQPDRQQRRHSKLVQCVLRHWHMLALAPLC